MHARKTARDAFFPSPEDDRFFALPPRHGDIVFSDGVAVRTFADRVNRGEGRSSDAEIRPAELAAMTLVHEVLHAVIRRYRERYPSSFRRLAKDVEAAIGPEARTVVVDFLSAFPPPAVYRTLQGQGDDVPLTYIERMRQGRDRDVEAEIDEELILLWVANQNPAYDSVRSLIDDRDLGPRYRAFVAEARRFFENEPRFGPKGETLLDLLAPGRLHPRSIFAQLGFIDDSWTAALGLESLGLSEKLAWTQDLRTEEAKWFAKGGPGPGEPLLEAMQFGRKADEEPARFSPDLNWMPNVVLIAKSIYVWLDQLSKKYGKDIRRLDHVPDEELDLLAARGLNGLWLIGIFERSAASRKVKQMRGDHDALASAYSLRGYEIARELGGVAAYAHLKARAWIRGIRLAADMVPNHVGIDGDWVIDHPDWFLSAPRPPYPNYRFGGPDLADDDRISVFLEEGYWNKTDAAVVFRRHDNVTGGDRFIYHGNDGTSMPWNDTAQLDYLNAEVRKAVIETILHVARMFPIIRFDAAMTLAKRHVQRLWYPLPGQGGAIPSRADYAMTQEEFDKAIPVEFWREVVDAVAERAPDTLLLAEAFWMMEGYFVRTLGMHRVYNSAFMNMLKREENDKYRETIRNVLDFDPEILKRFVNFMNNPDEETAALQFGDNSKYFGVCVLMSTMPGLPMFGHGQIEGLHEKYGMEYRRARSNEQPDEQLIQRHEREIFPILHKRHLFSGVDNFALYDFVTDSGRVDEDVYAYSNGVGSERALVIFNNRWKTTRGRIQASTHRGHVVEELGLSALAAQLGDEWLVLRDIPHGLDYLRRTKDLVEEGVTWDLGGFEYHVLTGFRPVLATHERPYDRLAKELAGRGVPDVEVAVRELYLRPIHAPLREACSKGHIDYLTAQLDAERDTAARSALEERLGHLADGLDWMLSRREDCEVTVDREAAIRGAGDRFAVLHAVVRAARSNEAAVSTDVVPLPVPVEEVAAPPAPASTVKVLPPADTTRTLEESAPSPKETSAADSTPPEVPPSRQTTEPEIPPSEQITEPEIPAPSSSTIDDDMVASSEELPEPTKPSEPAERGERGEHVTPPNPAPVDASVLHVDLLLALIQVEALLDLLCGSNAAVKEAHARPPTLVTTTTTTSPPPAKAATESASSPKVPASTGPAIAPTVSPVMWAEREGQIVEWELATPLVQGMSTIVEQNEARRRAALVLLVATLPTGPLATAMRLALGTSRGQTFMDVHESDRTFWLNKERFEELARFLAEREAASGRLTSAAGAEEARALTDLAEREGYRAERIATKLGPPPKITAG